MLVLIHSPLVGALTWRAVAAALSSDGRPCFVPDLAGALDRGPPYYPHLAQHVASGLPSTDRVVLIGHSFAGALLPAIAASSATPITAHVFVDALLPSPGMSWFQTVPPELATQVRSKTTNGILAPWHEWFPAEAIAAILPDPTLREHFTAEVPRLPLAMFDEPLPSDDVGAAPCAYLLLSSSYAGLADDATRRGWPVQRVDADHLAMLTQPRLVADRIAQLLDALP